MELVRAHEHVSSSFRSGSQPHSVWHKRGHDMLAKAGAALADIPGIVGDVQLHADPDDINSHLKKVCQDAEAIFSDIEVDSPWHPGGAHLKTGHDDDLIMRKWVILCDLVAEQAGVTPSYGNNTL